MGNLDEQPARIAGDQPNSNPELDSVRCEALRRSLAGRLLLCNYDELRVVDIDLGRLEKGREEHGYLDLSKPRDWQRERAEELVDARIYGIFDDIVETDREVAIIEAAADVDTCRGCGARLCAAEDRRVGGGYCMVACRNAHQEASRDVDRRFDGTDSGQRELSEASGHDGGHSKHASERRLAVDAPAPESESSLDSRFDDGDLKSPREVR